jgi:hypothetical protein
VPPPLLQLLSATTKTPDLSLTATPPGSCWKQDTQGVQNLGTQVRSWSWAVPTTSSSDTLEWSLDDATWFDASASQPTNISVNPGAQTVIYVAVDTTTRDGQGTPTGGCNTADSSSWSITLTDDLGRPQTFSAQLN